MLASNSSHVPVVYERAYLFKGVPLMPICGAAINAHLQPRKESEKLALTTVGKSTGSNPSMSSSPLRE